MIENFKKNLDKEKPPILYHGSCHRELEELEPRRKSHRDPEEGDLIFATPDFAIASIFLVDGASYGCGRFNDTPYAWILADRDEFIKNDRGGHIYVLPSDTFETTPGKGLGTSEWTSREKVKPIEKIEYASALDAMVENGVQVYFIDKGTEEKIKKSSDHGYSVFKNMKSENQLRNQNIKEL